MINDKNIPRILSYLFHNVAEIFVILRLISYNMEIDRSECIVVTQQIKQQQSCINQSD